MKRETIDLFNRIFKVLEPPPDLTLSQWADRYRRLSSESGSKGGKWNTEKAPWQREIMDAITDISVEKVVVMSAAQMGKTDAFLLNTIGYYMHYDPCTILCMQPTLSLAETMSKDRLMPMVRDTPALRDKINEKSRTAGNTIFKKAFPGGRITMTGANSPTELRSRPIRILLADEIDAYPPTAGAEGDPLILAGKRLTTYWNRKEVDQYAKHELGLHYYIRYMDDIIILHHDKKYLAEVKELLRAFLSDELRLDLNNKTTIRPCSMGVDFVGFRIWSTHRRLKKKTAVKIKRNLKNQIAKVKAGEERKDRLDRSVASYRGILSHFNSYGLRQSLNTLFKENGMVEKKEEVSRCTGNCNNCPNYTESYFCGFATPYCKLQGKEITHNVY